MTLDTEKNNKKINEHKTSFFKKANYLDQSPVKLTGKKDIQTTNLRSKLGAITTYHTDIKRIVRY